jgi:hypothetical protein
MVTATGRHVTNLGTLYGRVYTVKYGHIPWYIAARSPNIHNVGSGRSPTARATVPHTCMIVRNTDMHAVTYCHELWCNVCTCVSAKYEHIHWAIAARSLNIHDIMSAYDDVTDVTAGRVGDRVFYLAPATDHTAHHPADAYRDCIWWPVTSRRAVIFVYAI